MTSKIKITLLICVSMLCCYSKLIAQENLDNFQKMVDILPPAPNASAIIKHSAIQVNKNTGSPAINIPLFTVKGNKLSANMSIGYSSTGIKVDEIASRVGIGWSLQAGGVITRTVRGWPDENSTRIAPPTTIGYNCGTFNFCDKIVTSTTGGSFDAEPDLFNFSMNGISGSFILDENMDPMVIPAEKYKVEKNFSGTTWNFKITTTDGVMYYFGGTGATEKSKRQNNCGREFTAYMPTAWYLTKIEHPTGETINFTYTAINYTYDNGVSETMNWASPQIEDGVVVVDPGLTPAVCGGFTAPPASPTSRCINTIRTEGVLLTGISSDNNSVDLWYESRSDCTDKLLSYVRLYNSGVYAGRFNFSYNQQAANLAYETETSTGYNYTPYLTSLQQLSSDDVTALTHRFVYDDPANRPPRLSFSQDHWGYFNGKINSVFIPKPDDLTTAVRFPNATANRDPDPAFAGKGMLVKIVYPTGGIDNIMYESNELLNTSQQYRNPHIFNCNVVGTGQGESSVEVSQSMTFTIDQPQILELTLNCINTGNGTVSNHFSYSDVEITNSLGGFIFQQRLLPDQGVVNVKLDPGSNIPADTYTLTYKARGAVVATDVTLKFLPATYTATAKNVIVGGVRVKRILSGNPSETPVIKRYYYAEPETLDESSLYSVTMPIYWRNYVNTLNCSTVVGFGGPNINAYWAYYALTSMYSNSLNNIFDYQSAPISYSSVIESEGENFEGGGDQTRFYVSADIPGTTVLGDPMLGAPSSNSSQFGNGKVYEEIILKKPASGPLFPIKKTRYNYTIDSRVSRDLLAYAVNKKYVTHNFLPGPSCPVNTAVVASTMEAYDITAYHVSSPWMHLENEVETLYDENGLDPVTTTRNYYFDNTDHLQLTRTEFTNSKNQLLKNILTYPSDHIGTTVYDAMITNNILTAPVTNTTSIAHLPTDIPVAETAIDYGNAGGNSYAPVTVKKSAKGNALEIEGTIDQYDSKGNILQFTNKAGIVSSIIWGYNYQYPVAQITGATYTAATSHLTVTMSALQAMDGSSLRSELNNVRTGLPGLSVTTYTYKPGTGVTSITDPNNKINTYEYDGLNRLIVVKDQDGNAVKRNDYTIAGSNPASVLTVYLSHEVSNTFTCATCLPGYTGTSVVYTVPYGKYFSLVSQTAADAQADADNGGQEYANIKGNCANTITCPGPAYKVVNCGCELGTRVCENVYDNGNGTYNVSYRYHWSDNTSSQLYTDVISCSGPDKKIVNCVCETGVRTCGTPTDNGNGTYTVTYHYHWSDNTDSQDYTETFACSGADKKIVNCQCETGVKIYLTSQLCGKTNPPAGCCLGMWLCTYRYSWSDGTHSATYSECSSTPCTPPID